MEMISTRTHSESSPENMSGSPVLRPGKGAVREV